MMKRTFKRTLLISSLLVFSSLMSTGCFELNYKDTQEYYDLFDDIVYLYYANDEGTASSQTIKSLEVEMFNDDTVNDVHEVDTIDEEYYEYLVIQPTTAVTIQDFALFINSPETARFEVRIFLTNALPSTDSMRSFGLEATDDQGNEKSYADDYSNPINVTEITAKQNIWVSMYANSWKVDGKETKYIDVGVMDFIVVQFLNNTGYGVDLGYEPIKFSIVNLMVSPKNEKYAVEED